MYLQHIGNHTRLVSTTTDHATAVNEIADAVSKRLREDVDLRA
jgi:hypothetical protein